ncbi:hypothetical protein HJG60_008150 [Phyllostomus discolor]|uniref:Uncharacterized protein n=1 Tax=Phyllostomus discolor TaxID=89673 RepID=A0A834DQD1_9CHIR|nr:hypothetical protein HJG60_008150 [Phyllostomus discolor]
MATKRKWLGTTTVSPTHGAQRANKGTGADAWCGIRKPGKSHRQRRRKKLVQPESFTLKTTNAKHTCVGPCAFVCGGVQFCASRPVSAQKRHPQEGAGSDGGTGAGRQGKGLFRFASQTVGAQGSQASQPARVFLSVFSGAEAQTNGPEIRCCQRKPVSLF